MTKFAFYLIIVLIISNFITWGIIINYIFFPEKVAFLDVGEGDAELIITKAGNILIDAGPNNKIVFELSKILPFYERTIDLVILSHPNGDHFNGIFELLDKYKIRAVMLNNVAYPSSSFQKLLKEFKSRQLPLIQGFRGVRLKWQNTDELLVIFPFKQFSYSLNPNASCLVVNLNLADNQFLFTGDINSAQEKKIIQDILALAGKIKILKVAHHGSNYSSSKIFLDAFKPQFAIIEVGKNHYYHPHPEVLKRLNEIGAQVFRTDTNGTIQFILKDNVLKIIPDKL